MLHIQFVGGCNSIKRDKTRGRVGGNIGGDRSGKAWKKSLADCATMKVHSRISYLSRPVQKLMTGSTQEKVSSRLVGKSLRAGLDLHGIMREMNYTCGRAARDYRDFNPVSDHYSRNHGSRRCEIGVPRTGMRAVLALFFSPWKGKPRNIVPLTR